jgi:hypothetical protein
LSAPLRSKTAPRFVPVGSLKGSFSQTSSLVNGVGIIYLYDHIIKHNMPNKLSIQNVLTRLLGKKRFAIDINAKQFITSNPQWKNELSNVIDRDLPMNQAIDTMLAKYPILEATMRKAANQDTNRHPWHL